MRFTLTGVLKDSPGAGRLSFTWEDSHLSGDPMAVEALKAMALAMEGQLVGSPTGPFTETNHLAEPLSTVFLAIDWVFDRQTRTTSGRLPTVPEKPGRIYSGIGRPLCYQRPSSSPARGSAIPAQGPGHP